MYILALESTGAHASVAVINESGETIELRNEGTLNHLEHLIPMVQALLEGEGIAKSQIDYVAVSAGPGSFTGIRIGVTTARALAQTLEIPAVSVDTLKSFAYGAMDFDGIICPVIDARRGQCYAGAYQWKDGSLQVIIPSGPYMMDEYLAMLEGTKEPCMFFGDGIKKYGEKIFESGLEVVLAPQEVRLQNAKAVAKMALELVNNGETVEYGRLEPIYMRKPEAEQKREERLRNGGSNI